MILSRAGDQDIQLLLDFRNEAARWLATRGSDQWQRPWPSPSGLVAAVRSDITRGSAWILRDGERPAATITVDDAPNPGLWTADEATEPALYAHKLIVRRVYAGQGIGAELIDWAGTRASNLQRRWLRLDAWTTNTSLQDYYRLLGFQHVRTVHRDDNPSGALFQRPAARQPTPRITEAFSSWSNSHGAATPAGHVDEGRR